MLGTNRSLWIPAEEEHVHVSVQLCRRLKIWFTAQLRAHKKTLSGSEALWDTIFVQMASHYELVAADLQ